MPIFTSRSFTTPKLPSNMYSEQQADDRRRRDVGDHHRDAHEAAAAELQWRNSAIGSAIASSLPTTATSQRSVRHRLSRNTGSPASAHEVADVR